MLSKAVERPKSRIIASAHTEMHSSQMLMPFGPAIIAVTWSDDFPQNAQYTASSPR
jgi:hypothetical protein